MANVLGWSQALSAEIFQCAKIAQQDAGDARHVVYAILDPTKQDAHGVFHGMPFYVGETGDIGARVINHFERACGDLQKLSGVRANIRGLLDASVIATFVILQWFDQRFDGREAETRWAQALLAKGYPLTNLPPFQSQILSPEELEGCLARHRWGTSIADATAAGLQISASCDWCGRGRMFRPDEFLNCFGEWESLKRIREMASCCHGCGEPYVHKILRQHERVAAFTPMTTENWEL